jgi:hypothetical protein
MQKRMKTLAKAKMRAQNKRVRRQQRRRSQRLIEDEVCTFRDFFKNQLKSNFEYTLTPNSAWMAEMVVS